MLKEMMWGGFRPVSVVLLTCMFAVLLTFMPLPTVIKQFQPDWILLVTAYWVLMRPDYIGLGWAWTIGLLCDVLMSQVLGTYALTFLCVAAGLILFQRRLLHAPMWLRTLYMGGFIVMAILLRAIIVYLTSQPALPISVLWSACLDILIWPVLVMGLDAVRIRYV